MEKCEPLKGTASNPLWQEGREHTWKEGGELTLIRLKGVMMYTLDFRVFWFCFPFFFKVMYFL